MNVFLTSVFLSLSLSVSVSLSLFSLTPSSKINKHVLRRRSLKIKIKLKQKHWVRLSWDSHSELFEPYLIVFPTTPHGFPKCGGEGTLSRGCGRTPSMDLFCQVIAIPLFATDSLGMSLHLTQTKMTPTPQVHSAPFPCLSQLPSQGQLLSVQLSYQSPEPLCLPPFLRSCSWKLLVQPDDNLSIFSGKSGGEDLSNSIFCLMVSMFGSSQTVS